MKILAFVDTHGSDNALKKVLKKAKNADVIVCAGDITIFGTGLKQILSRLDKTKKPVLVIPGNHEDEIELRELCKGFKNVHYINKTRIVVEDYLFLGYDGDGFSMEEPEFKPIAKKFKKWMKGKKTIFVTHAPPYGTELDLILDGHCGNKTLRKFIEKNKIELTISGHIHENAGKKDKIKGTIVINPGPYGKMIKV